MPAKEFTFVQITDTHIGYSYNKAKDEEVLADRRSRPWGDGKEHAPAVEDLLSQAIQKVKDDKTVPEFVVFTGDLGNRASREEEINDDKYRKHLDKFLKILKNEMPAHIPVSLV